MKRPRMSHAAPTTTARDSGLTTPIGVGSVRLLGCTVCGELKPRVVRHTECRECYNAKYRKFRKEHPKLVASWQKKSRSTEKYRAKRRVQERNWRSRNNACGIENRHRKVKMLADAYVCKFLRAEGVPNPTQEQIEVRRRKIQLNRARRNLAILMTRIQSESDQTPVKKSSILQSQVKTTSLNQNVLNQEKRNQ